MQGLPEIADVVDVLLDGPETEVVGHPPVDQVKVRLLLRIQHEFDGLPHLAQPVAGRGRLEHGGPVVAARAGIVLERDRRQHARDGGRGGAGAGHGEFREIGADGVERALVEGEPQAEGHVRGVDDDHGPLAPEHVPEGLPFEDLFAEILGGKVAAVEERGREPEPVDGVHKHAGGNGRLDVFLQEAPLEILEDAIAEQAEIGGRETPAGNTRDHVDLVREPPFLPAQGDLRGPQLLEDPVGKGRRPGAPSRERQDQQQLLRVALGPHVPGDVPVAGSVLLQRRVDRVVPEMAAARRRREKQHQYPCQNSSMRHIHGSHRPLQRILAASCSTVTQRRKRENLSAETNYQEGRASRNNSINDALQETFDNRP